jgi:hypothetical protein
MKEIVTLLGKHGASAAAGLLLGLISIAVIGVRTPGGMLLLIVACITVAILSQTLFAFAARLIRGRRDASDGTDGRGDP